MITFLHAAYILHARALGEFCVPSDHFARCLSTSVLAFLQVSCLPRSSWLLPLQHDCRLFSISMHGHTKKCVSIGGIIYYVGLASPVNRLYIFRFWFGLSLFCLESILASSFRCMVCSAPCT